MATSTSVALHSLEKCSNKYPISLMAITKYSEGAVRVVGHSRLTIIPGLSDACFVESVVVSKEFRGKGYGKMLMAGTENFAKKHGFGAVYLTTHDAQEFYRMIGYDFCPPIVSIGQWTGTLMDSPMFNQLSVLNASIMPLVHPPTNAECRSDKKQAEVCGNPPGIAATVPPWIPPPPPPPGLRTPVIEHHPAITVHFMRKVL